MSFGIAMYIRDTALKFRQRGIDLTKQALNNMGVNRTQLPRWLWVCKRT